MIYYSISGPNSIGPNRAPKYAPKKSPKYLILSYILTVNFLGRCGEGMDENGAGGFGLVSENEFPFS